MTLAPHEPGTDAARLRQRGLRVTGPRLAILAMLQELGGHRSADELVLALRRAGFHHARTTVYNALDDLARAKLVRAAPVDAGALRYESAGAAHHHFVCRSCGLIRNVAVAADLANRAIPEFEGDRADEFDVVYRGLCTACVARGAASRAATEAAREAGSEVATEAGSEAAPAAAPPAASEAAAAAPPAAAAHSTPPAHPTEPVGRSAMTDSSSLSRPSPDLVESTER